MIPNDPALLLSFMNMKLRDTNKNLDALCDDLDVAKTQIVEVLKTIDYHYNEEQNQFK